MYKCTHIYTYIYIHKRMLFSHHLQTPSPQRILFLPCQATLPAYKRKESGSFYCRNVSDTRYVLYQHHI